MDLEQTLTSREEINTRLRIVLDEATGKWGIRVNRVEIKAIDPPITIKEAMEKQMRAERDKRAAILHAEGERQSKILTAEGTRQQEILVAQGDQQAAILRADGEARPSTWFSRPSTATTQIPRCWPTSTWRRCLTWQEAATPSGSSQVSSPRRSAPSLRPSATTPGWGARDRQGQSRGPPSEIDDQERSRELTSGGPPSFDAVAAADRVAELAEAAVNDAKAEAAAAQTGIEKALNKDARPLKRCRDPGP